MDSMSIAPQSGSGSPEDNEALPRVGRRWQLKNRPAIAVDDDTFELVSVEIPEVREGQYLVQVCYLSLAPVMRAYVIDGGVIESPLAIGETMRGRGVGRILASKAPGLDAGDIVHGPFGWQEYALMDDPDAVIRMSRWGESISEGLSVLGLTGMSAYFGLFDKGRPQAGDVVLVSGAVGGVGSVVGQLARIAGAYPVGICGSPAKCEVAVRDLGYTAAINYKTEDVAERLSELCPDGIDVFFDNVGGAMLEAGIAAMADDGRIVICGAISQYLNEVSAARGPANYFDMVYRNVSMLGFHVYAYKRRYAEAERRMVRWLGEGRLRALEDRLVGLEQMPSALVGLFEGDNVGKRVVQIAPEPGAGGA